MEALLHRQKGSRYDIEVGLTRLPNISIQNDIATTNIDAITRVSFQSACLVLHVQVGSQNFHYRLM
jgi:hypothetical protein